MVSRKSMVPLVIAVIFGIGAAVFARGWLKGRMADLEAQQRDGVAVVVAASEIPFGEKIELDQLKITYWPHDSVPDGVFNDPAEVVGKISNQKIVQNEVILRQRAIRVGGGSSLAGLIDPEMRAVTVRVNDVIGVGGFLLPGNRVDVLATRLTDQRRAQTRTLLENIKVLAVDQTSEADKDKPVVVRAVTLAVDAKQAVQLVQATEEGTVQMALRNPEALLVGVTEEEPEKPRQASRPASSAPSVTIIRQTQVGGSGN